ncbi:MAG TPA: methyltransferase domain-containing protein [Blastocatellia bacterium]|nr:methyltransferase domain-containing protein [Blastocatellia bacterium]
MNDTGEKPRALHDDARAMKRDWDERARQNAKWFINTVRQEQSDAEFDETGAFEMRQWVLPELTLLTQGRDPKTLKLLEVGCGIGRMTRHLAALFGEVCATDVSGEMIRRARERSGNLPNTSFRETNGVDFAGLPDDYFDIVFSVYVFQHVPSREVIRANIRDAYRVLKPGGIIKFHTNGVTAPAYEEVEKDTWIGASFAEADIRQCARELGAQLVSIYGAETGYCWTTFRKRLVPAAVRQPLVIPRIEFYGRADDAAIRRIPTGGDDAWLSLVVSGLAPEEADANNLIVEFNGQAVRPRYVGRMRPHYEAALKAQFGPSPGHLTYIEAGVLPDAAGGSAQVRVRPDEGEASPPVVVELESSPPGRPRIVTVRNGDDYGTDIYAQGPKSLLKITVEGLGEKAGTGNVRLQIGGRFFEPAFVGFVAHHGSWQVDARLPEDTKPGLAELRVYSGGVPSPGVQLQIR